MTDSPAAPRIDGAAEKNRAALVSLLAALGLTCLKLGAGLYTDSLGILFEALHSGLDMLAAGMTLAAVRIAAKPPDAEHPYGHGKIENLSALAETLLLAASCVWVGYEGSLRLLGDEKASTPSLVGVGVMLVSVAVDANRVRVLRRVAREHKSQALEADALHFSTDILSSAIVLAGVLVVWLADCLRLPPPLAGILFQADTAAALIVALVILRVSLRMALEAINALMDSGSLKEEKAVARAVNAVPGITAIRRLRLRNSGPLTFVELAVGVEPDIHVSEGHRLAHEAEKAVECVLPGSDVTVHVEPLSVSALHSDNPIEAADRSAHKMTGDLSDLAMTYGYPFYLYDEKRIAARLALLRDALPEFTVLYSVKANPHPGICRFMSGSGAGADAASGAEVQKALAAGFDVSKIFYSAPGKPDRDLRAAFGACVLTADSYAELERVNGLAAESGRIEEIGLRVNPAAAFGAGSFPELLPGAASKFGVDEEGLAEHREFIAGLKNIRLRGFHVFLRSQILSHKGLLAYCRHIFALARSWTEIFHGAPRFVNFGGGFGIACGEWKQALALDALGKELRSLVTEQKRVLPDTVLCIESGRFLVAEAGVFVTRVEDVKISRGTCFVIVSGGLNGFLRPAVMNLLNSPSLAVNGPLEPLYSNGAAHTVSLPEAAGRPERKVTVTGNLCTSLDVIARDVTLPDPRVGDILLVSNAGAYGASLSPFAFAGFPRPPELYRDGEGRIVTE